MKQRIALLVYVDLDPTQGAFDTETSARVNVAGILENAIDLYNPIVAHAPDSLQPPNHPRNMNDSQEIPSPQAVERILAHVPPVTIDTTYTEGNTNA